jgi:hypothetical protein
VWSEDLVTGSPEDWVESLDQNSEGSWIVKVLTDTEDIISVE